MNRREFLGGMLASGAAPMIFGGCSVFRANQVVNVGVVGCGRISTSFEIPCMLQAPNRSRVRLVAVCDLDDRRSHYAAGIIDREYNDGSKVAVYHDYKELCARPDIDAVMICVPDFWHALVATTAICAGKHVWLQKPFTQTIMEGRILANLAKRYGTILQVGSQQRSSPQFAEVCKAVRAGRLGRIKKVEIGLGIDVAGGSCRAEPVPATFDYDTWLGPTDHNVPYNWTRCHTQNLDRIHDRPGWIQLAPYGWGMITNWGAHHLDIARWGLDAVGCESVEGTCSWMDLSGGRLWNVHTHYDLHYSFNRGATEVHVCDRYQNGVKFIGENGDWLFCCRGAAKVTASDPDVKLPPGALPPLAASRDAILPDISGMPSDNQKELSHATNWVDALVAGKQSLALTDAEGGHRSTSICSLGQMCMELGRGRKDGFKLDWDVAKETTGNAEYDRLMKPFACDKFDLAVNLKEFGLKFDDVLRG